ncbi:hypothetical protein V7266_30440 [Neobacillus drentensis]|uniref:hypothetical protein n=1 Tax=Neobacillus drentensis TaxID=220684 RepID=UPI002FFF46DC
MENEKMMVTLSVKELDDLIYNTTYRAMKRALNNHFHGIVPFFNKMNDDLETIVKEIDYLKLRKQEE